RSSAIMSGPVHPRMSGDPCRPHMYNGDRQVRCGITRSALEVLAPELPHTKQGRVQAFKQHRARIEHSASVKFDRGAVEPDGRTVLIRVFDLIYRLPAKRSWREWLEWAKKSPQAQPPGTDGPAVARSGLLSRVVCFASESDGQRT